MTKRYNCTVSDRRGEFGLCMEKSTSGKFVLFSEYEKLLKKIKTFEKTKPSKKSVLGTEEEQIDMFGGE
jgi:hypothetical protein